MHTYGIHHITAISSDAQKTYDFYTNVLGLRLVKKSVNQDDVQTYHLFFGNKTGEPGMDLTFFPFADVPAGQRGVGLVTTISFAIPIGSLSFWEERFEELQVVHDSITEAFGQKRMMFYDHDKQRLELVEVAEIEDRYTQSMWTQVIPPKQAIQCFHCATLDVLTLAQIQPVLELFGYELTTEKPQQYLFHLPGVTNAAELLVEEKPTGESSINGSGTVHHIAFQVQDRKTQIILRKKLTEIGEQPTQVIDRYYFTSVYFRTKAGILFEIATMGPGFTVDEDETELGKKLALPPFLEKSRAYIERNITPLHTA